MAHVCLSRDGLPISATAVKPRPDVDIEISAHSDIIAKFCAIDKQHIAATHGQSSAMAKKSLNQVLAENLNRLFVQRQLTNKALGKKAGVAPNTIANYRAGNGEAATASGKERSAKLAEVERIANALGVDPLYLLTDPEQHALRVQAITSAVLSATMPAQNSPGSQQSKPPKAA